MPIGIPVSPNPPGSLMSATPVTDAIGGGITSVSIASPTVIGFAADHGLETGASITIAGTSTTPTTVGTFVVTVTDSSHVTIPVAVTVVTTGTGPATVKALQQQVGGTLTANAGTNLNTSALALEGGGNLAAIATSTAKIPAQGAAAKAASLPVTMAMDQPAIPASLASLPALTAGEAHIGALGGATVAVSGSVTRPANVTAYAAGQVVGTASTDVITIANAARKVGGSGVLLDLLLIDQGGAAAAGSFEVYLFTASPTAQADQATFALVAADIAALVAVVPVGGSYVTNVAATISGSRVYPVTGVNAGFVCAGGSTSLYAAIVTRGAYTPISAEAFTVVAQIAQD